MLEVEFYGEKFTVADEINEFALLEFAEAADQGTDADSMAGMAAMLRFVLSCVVEDDQKRLRSVARKNRAGSQDLMKLVQAVGEVRTERPTGQPSVSTDGPTTTVPKSVSSYDDKVVTAFPGRPEIQAGILDMLDQRTG